jgi:hypothetical protein
MVRVDPVSVEKSIDPEVILLEERVETVTLETVALETVTLEPVKVDKFNELDVRLFTDMVEPVKVERSNPDVTI